MKMIAFWMLSQILKLFPSMVFANLNKLNGFQKAIIGARYWVTCQYLDAKNKH
jgi:hypothetical protein